MILRKTLIFTLTNHQVLKDNTLLLDEIKKATTIDAIKAEVLKINKIRNEVTVLVTYEASKESM